MKNCKKTLNYLLHDYNNCSITSMLKNHNSNLSKSLDNNQLIQNFLSFNSSTYNEKYTREIIKKYSKNIKHIKYYNFILGGTINLCSNLLNTNEEEINHKFIEIRSKNNLNKFYNTIHCTNIHKKKYYIYFFILYQKLEK